MYNILLYNWSYTKLNAIANVSFFISLSLWKGANNSSHVELCGMFVAANQLEVDKGG